MRQRGVEHGSCLLLDLGAGPRQQRSHEGGGTYNRKTKETSNYFCGGSQTCPPDFFKAPTYEGCLQEELHRCTVLLVTDTGPNSGWNAMWAECHRKCTALMLNIVPHIGLWVGLGPRARLDLLPMG